MSALTVDDFRLARMITSGPKHRGLSEDDALSVALDRLLIFNDSDLTVPRDEKMQLPINGGELPQPNRIRSGRDELPKFTSKLRRIRLGGFEYLRSIVHTNSHNTSPSGSGSTALTVDASTGTVGEPAADSFTSPSGESAAPTGDAA